MIEEWKDIPTFSGLYQASSLGRIKSLARATKTKKGQRTYKEKILTAGIAATGYFVVNISLGSTGVQQHKVHRLVALAFLGVSDEQVNHKDLNKTNNCIDNLEYVTNFENSLRAFKNEVRIGKTKTTAIQREKIRTLRKAGLTLKYIGRLHNLSESAVSEIARGTTWAWENK